jgi:hypothetical protein
VSGPVSFFAAASRAPRLVVVFSFGGMVNGGANPGSENLGWLAILFLALLRRRAARASCGSVG